MKPTLITNAFSLNMLDANHAPGYVIDIIPVSVEYINKTCPVLTSAVGHKDTAALISGILGREVEMNRCNVNVDSIDPEVGMVVAQYRGPRLAEGVTTLPQGSSIQFYHIIPMKQAIPAEGAVA